MGFWDFWWLMIWSYFLPLRDDGTITQAEFEGLEAKALAA